MATQNTDQGGGFKWAESAMEEWASAAVRQELMKRLIDAVKKVSEFMPGKIDEFLRQAQDITVETRLNGEVVGCNVVISDSQPRIELTYHDDKTIMVGEWGNTRLGLAINNDIGQAILQKTKEMMINKGVSGNGQV